MIKKQDRAYGTTDMESPLAPWDQYKILWHLLHHKVLWTKHSNILGIADL